MIKTSLVNTEGLKAKTTGFNPIPFHFNIRGKLSIIQCDGYLFLFREKAEEARILVDNVIKYCQIKAKQQGKPVTSFRLGKIFL